MCAQEKSFLFLVVRGVVFSRKMESSTSPRRCEGEQGFEAKEDSRMSVQVEDVFGLAIFVPSEFFRDVFW